MTVGNKETRAMFMYIVSLCFLFFSLSDDAFKQIKFNAEDGKTNRVSFNGEYKLSEKGLPQ